MKKTSKWLALLLALAITSEKQSRKKMQKVVK